LIIVCGVDRRSFLKSCSIIAAATLAAGARGASAEQLGVRWVNALAARGGEVTYAVPTADGVQVDREHSILLTRYQGNVYAFSMVCPHQRAAVKWLEDQHIFQCTKASEVLEAGPASPGARPQLNRYPPRVVSGAVDETTRSI
jgi:nitrite reductase/ring-hydroxylating ferredoxin subunit